MATKNSERFYWANGEKVELALSSRFAAVRAADDADRDEVSGRLAGLAQAADVLSIPDEGLFIICAPEGNGDRPAAATPTGLTRAATASKMVTAGPPVFESAAAPDVALVPRGTVLVKLAPGADADALFEAHNATITRRDYPEPGAYVVSVGGDVEAIDAANRLAEEDGVEYAEPDFLQVTKLPADLNGGITTLDRPDVLDLRAEESGMEARALAPPNDPGYSSQWGLQKIRAPQAWDISAGDPSIVVAIVDEGNDITHEDVTYVAGYDAYAGDANPTPNGNDAHGTACGGIAAASRNNSRGGAGVAPASRVMGIRIAQGIGGGFWSTSSAIVSDGIRRAVDMGADVLSNSYSVGPSSAVTSAFQYAQTTGRGGLGCAIAAASGNGDTGTVIYPARLSPTIPGFLAVGASNEFDERKSKTSADGEHWWGSNWGPELDVVAPGVHIYTTDIMGSAGYGGGNYVPNFNGTSSATPHVAGLMALILSVDPNLRSWEVEDIIKLTAKDLGAAGRDDYTGYGRIDARRALEAASKVWSRIRVRPEFIGNKVFMRADVRLYNPGINAVRINKFVLRSHTNDWSNEIDRFEYEPDPGGIMQPQSGDDLVFKGILLKANGSRRRWSYRWSASWTYTYWRPSGPGFPLGAPLAASGPGEHGSTDQLRSGDEGESDLPEDTSVAEGNGLVMPATGDSIEVDRSTRTITITVR